MNNHNDPRVRSTERGANPPPKLDFKSNGERLVFKALLIMKKPTLLINPENSEKYITMRLTAKRARDFAKWFERYAQWAEKLPSQGGR